MQDGHCHFEPLEGFEGIEEESSSESRIPEYWVEIENSPKMSQAILQIWHPYQELTEQLEKVGYKSGSFQLVINNHPMNSPWTSLRIQLRTVGYPDDVYSCTVNTKLCTHDECMWCSHTTLEPLFACLRINGDDWRGWMISLYNERNNRRIFWIWVQQGQLCIYTLADEEFRFEKGEGGNVLHMLLNYERMEFKNRNVLENLFQRFKCRWGFETRWKIRQAATGPGIRNSILPSFEKLNRALGAYTKIRLIPSLTARVDQLIQKARTRRSQLMKDSMKKMPFYVIRYSDSRHRFQGLYYDLPTESPPLEFQYQDTFAFGNPRNPNQKGSLEAINEILWEEYLPYCLDSYQLIDNKKAILKALGFEKRRLPNGWIGIYDVRRHFRIVLIGLQVQNRHHTEYYQILTSLEQKGAEIHMRTIQNMKNLPTSAALTNKISMELIGESYEEIFGGYINDLTVVTAQRNPNSVEYEF